MTTSQNAPASSENEIRASMSARLDAATSRKEKTRVAATALFFEFGIYPSAKTVHSYTQQGSMTDINADLREFWTDIREKSRVQISAPYLPVELNENFSAALAKLWDLATENAAALVEAERQECRESVADAEQKVLRATEVAESLQGEVRNLESGLAQERDKRSAAESQGAALNAQVDALRASLGKAEGQIRAVELARQEAMVQFSRDLDTERAARKRDADMLHGEIKFAKMQIEAARAAENEARERFKADMASLDIELSRYRQRLSKSEDDAARLVLEVIEQKSARVMAENQLVAIAAKERTKIIERPTPGRMRTAVSIRRKKL